MITAKAGVKEIFDYAVKAQGMKPLRESAAELVRMGITTAEEFIRVTYSV